MQDRIPACQDPATRQLGCAWPKLHWGSVPITCCLPQLRLYCISACLLVFWGESANSWGLWPPLTLKSWG